MNGIWVVVVNKSVAKFFAMRSAQDSLTKVHEIDNDRAHLRTQDIDSDRPGRVSAKGNGLRHSLSPHVDPQRHIVEVHAKAVARYLEEQRNAGAFSELILMAAPKLLGEVRANLDRCTTKCVIAAFDKDIAGQNDRAIMHDGEIVNVLRDAWSDPRRVDAGIVIPA